MKFSWLLQVSYSDHSALTLPKHFMILSDHSCLSVNGCAILGPCVWTVLAQDTVVYMLSAR